MPTWEFPECVPKYNPYYICPEYVQNKKSTEYVPRKKGHVFLVAQMRTSSFRVDHEGSIFFLFFSL